MWGVSVPVVLRVAFVLHESRLQEALNLFRAISAANQVVLVAGTSKELELRFRGPLQAGGPVVH